MNRRSFLTAAALVAGSHVANSSKLAALSPAEEQAASQIINGSVGPGGDYEKRMEWALSQNTDVWGEELIQKGGATYENIKDLVQPLWYDFHVANGQANVDRYGVTWGVDGGEQPWIVAIADGSRLYGNNRRSIRFLRVLVGSNADEEFGSSIDRLRGPSLAGGFYPLLSNEYTDSNGNLYTQESFAPIVHELGGIVAVLKLTVKRSASGSAPKVRVAVSEYDLDLRADRLLQGQKTVALFSGSPKAVWDQHTCDLTWDGSDVQEIYVAWLATPRVVENFRFGAEQYQATKASLEAYWDERLAKGANIQVPEGIVGNALRSTIISNLVLRYRYGLGSWDYHTDWYPRESCDSLNGLALHGHTDAYRDGLNYMLGKHWREREFGHMATWGEYMAHAARYFFLSHDADFIRQNTPTYEQYARAMQDEIATDPNGLVHKTHRTADVGKLGYWTNEEAVCWRGLRDMSEVWRLTNHNKLWERYSAVAAGFRKALRKAVSASQVRMPDGSLFVPIQLLARETPYDSLWQTTMGGYWNLTFPYAMASGLWEANEQDMDGIIAYMRQHGSFFLGLLRFTITPDMALRTTEPGQFYGQRLDNVYLTGYVQTLAERDDTEHLLLSFYGKLAHGMTRGTFEEGETSSLSPDPERPYRWTNAPPTSTNGALYLELVRLLLVREGFDSVTGVPDSLYLAYATPRHWMAEAKEISVTRAPTWFGPVAYRIRSNLAAKRVTATVELPTKETAKAVKLKLRVPGNLAMKSVTVNGRQWSKFDQKAEVIDLTGLSSTVEIEARY